MCGTSKQWWACRMYGISCCMFSYQFLPPTRVLAAEFVTDTCYPEGSLLPFQKPVSTYLSYCCCSFHFTLVVVFVVVAAVTVVVLVTSHTNNCYHVVVVVGCCCSDFGNHPLLMLLFLSLWLVTSKCWNAALFVNCSSCCKSHCC